MSFRLLGLSDGKHPTPWENSKAEFTTRKFVKGEAKGCLWLENWSGISYLTAQGFSERQPVPVTHFEVEARVHDRHLSECDSVEDANNWQKAKNALVDAMALIGLLGGLGARARRGFGSLAVTHLRAGETDIIPARPMDIAAYGALIETHLGNERHPGRPPYSALSEEFCFQICAEAEDARELMNDIGWAFQIFRSYGQNISGGEHQHIKIENGQRLALEAGDAKPWYRAKFKADHDDFYERVIKSKNAGETAFDNRAVFGLPHNYYKTEVGWDKADLAAPPNTPQARRRASPLVFHFHQVGTSVVFVASVIESDFAPVDAYLRVGGRLRDNAALALNANIDFSLARAFASFLRDPDATGKGCGVQHTTFKRIEDVTSP